MPVSEQFDPEVVSFLAQLDQKSSLDEMVREKARRMLQSVINAKVEAFIAMHEDRRDERGRRQVVKNGSLRSGRFSREPEPFPSLRAGCGTTIPIMRSR